MRSLMTTVLDLVGMVLIVVTLALLAAEMQVTALARGLGVAGVGMLIVSWWIDGHPLPRRKGKS